MQDLYHWWREALAGRMHGMHDGDPQPGFYKLRRVKGGPWLPVAIWAEDDGIACIVAGQDADADATWLACARHPVSEADYRHAEEHGAWPGDLPATPPAAAGSVAGHNSAPSGVEAIAEEVTQAVAAADAWLSGRMISTQAEADEVQHRRERLAELGKRADAAREAAKRPHLLASRTVDETWRPVITAAEDAARRCREALTPYLRQQQEAKRQAAAQAVASGADQARTDTRATAGTQGRRAALRTQTSARITDIDAVLQFLRNHPDMVALAQRLADKVARAGGSMPGVEVVTTQVAA